MDQRPVTKPAPISGPTALFGENAIACDCEKFLGPGGPLETDGLRHMTLQALNREVLQEIRPSLVILPLFGPNHDAASAVELLEELGYSGRITVIAPILPRPKLVERELRALGPKERLVLISP